jgi:citrate synthase
MSDKATVTIEGKTYEYPIVLGSEGEKAIDTRNLRADTGYITYDEGFANTGSCLSNITFIDGEKGILRYRGYPIEQLAKHSSFISTAYLIIYGDLPNAQQREIFRENIRKQASVNTAMNAMFDGFPARSHPMAILSAMMNSLGCYYPHMASNNREQDLEHFDEAAALMISKVRTIAAMSYRAEKGLPFVWPRADLRYTANFLHMMFSEPYATYEPDEDTVEALDLFLLLHADHEQNCSTSTVRMVASSGANLFASVAAGVCGLWGPLHGGANAAVVKMLMEIHKNGDDGSTFIKNAKEGKARLMGFGHRVYKNFDPRAKILGKAVERVLANMGRKDPLLDIARRLEESALSDNYFVDRKLYPNVDFYSGLLLRAIGIPLEMFTVMFAIGRIPGWIANWREVAITPKQKIYRPRQIFMGPARRELEDIA